MIFKIGDKVRIIKRIEDTKYPINIGDVGEISRIDNLDKNLSTIVTVAFSDYEELFYIDELELVENKENNNMNNTIKFAKVKPNAIIPSKREEDAGFDIYACLDEDYIIINPHETKMIPTGIASAFSSDYVVILKERGSTGTKGIGQRCGVIDSGFRGEYFVPITNHNDIPLIIANTSKAEICDYIFPNTIYPTTKAICQAIVVPVPRVTIEEVTYEDLKNIASERGVGSLGSSKK